ncbi:TAXI family TRAP transporter solute-binding subunit [Alcaligenaceae bacterium]|nr:TAXI family TRAP transporter solute-binding subunit [Alcaligenaceae bacterium]
MLKKIFKITLLLSATTLAAGCGQESGPDTKPMVSLSVGTTNTSSSLYAYYSGLIKSVKQQAPEINMTIIETGATIDNITRLQKGQIDIGLAVMDGAYEAYEGTGKWAGNAQSDLRTLFTYTENAVYYAVTKDSGVTSMQGLEGKKFNLGIKGSTTENQTTEILKLLGVAVVAHTGDVSDAVNAIKDGDIIGLTKTGVGTSGDATIMDLETSKKLQLLGYTDEEVAKIQAAYPWLRTTVIPAGIYDWHTKSVTTLAQQVGNIANTKMSVDTAYKITKAAFEEKKYQEESYKSIKALDFKTLTLDSPIPLHAGTVKYLKEAGVDVPKKLIPSEYKD